MLRKLHHLRLRLRPVPVHEPAQTTAAGQECPASLALPLSHHRRGDIPVPVTNPPKTPAAGQECPASLALPLSHHRRGDIPVPVHEPAQTTAAGQECPASLALPLSHHRRGDPAKTFEDFLAWQKAHQFVLAVYRLSQRFPALGNLWPDITISSRCDIHSYLRPICRPI